MIFDKAYSSHRKSKEKLVFDPHIFSNNLYSVGCAPKVMSCYHTVTKADAVTKVWVNKNDTIVGTNFRLHHSFCYHTFVKKYYLILLIWYARTKKDKRVPYWLFYGNSDIQYIRHFLKLFFQFMFQCAVLDSILIY